MNREELLGLLVCPVCQSRLELLPDAAHCEGLACEKCALVYPVREGIPVMLPEEALTRDAWNSRDKNSAAWGE